MLGAVARGEELTVLALTSPAIPPFSPGIVVLLRDAQPVFALVWVATHLA